MLHLWKAFPKFWAEAKPSTWIYQIALNTIISDYRRNKKMGQKVVLNEGFFEIPDDDTNPEQQELSNFIDFWKMLKTNN